MRRIVFGTAIALLLPLLAAPQLSGQVTSRPNILVILLDDFDDATLQLAAANGLAPNIKQFFLDQGHRFTTAFSTSTFGSPVRATFLTGQYPHNHGEIGGNPILGAPPKFNESSTVATWLRAAGYRTAHVGRYLTGYGWFTPPTSIPPGWDDWVGLVDPTTWSTEKFVINGNGTLIDVGAAAEAAGTEIHQTDVLTYLTGAILQQAPAYGRPFFVTVAPTVFNRERYPGPTNYNVCPDETDPLFGGNYWGVAQKPPARHRDTVFGNLDTFALPRPPSFNEEDMSDKPLWAQNPLLTEVDIDCLQKRYWRKLEAFRAVDDMVGYLISRLASTGALNNTAVILTSDGGDLDGEHRFPEKMPAFESSIRVPLLIRLPGQTTPKTIARLVLNTDLAPTIAALARVTPPIQVDGRSLLPLMQNPALATWRKIALIEHSVTITDSNFGFPPSYLALRAQLPTPLTYVRYPSLTTGVTGELYDLTVDPFQLENRIGDPALATQISQLNLRLALLYACKGSSCVYLENNW